MRIIAGKDKGRRLKSLKTRDVRPTSDRAKEALFNILASSIVGTRFLDLYAGFGGIGIEALSRGAYEAIFIEEDDSNLEVINYNLDLVDYQDKSRVIRGDVLKSLPILQGDFDFIFMDPPYDQTELYLKTLNLIQEYNLLAQEGIIVIEHNFDNELKLPKGYNIIKKKRYGKAAITLVSKEKE